MKLTYSETALICRGFAVLLRGGIGEAEGAYLLAEGENGKLRGLLTRMGEKLDTGEALSAVMEQEGAFPHHAVVMVRIGEETGRLDQALAALGEYYDEYTATTRKVKNALAYPCMILALLLVVIGVLLVKVMPVFDNVYASLGSRLTGAAAGLLYAGGILKNILPVLLVLCLALVAGAALITKNARLRAKAAEWYQKRFGDKGIARRFNNARFARALSMGLSSGLPLEEAMSLSASLLDDVPGAAARCRECIQMLEAGETLSAAMSAAGLLSPAQTRVFTAGLRGGNGDEVLDGIADRMQEEASDALEGVVARVEPTIVMAVSLLVGLILLSVMLPLMNIMSAIG